MGELIFFGVIIFFSILESIARQRKQRAEKAEEAEGGGTAVGRGAGWPDDGDEAEGAPRTAEGMVPRDLWEEIAGLAAGRTTEAERPPAPAPRPRAAGREPASTSRPGGPRQKSTPERRAPRPKSGPERPAPRAGRPPEPGRRPVPAEPPTPAPPPAPTRRPLPDEAVLTYDGNPSYDDLAVASRRVEHPIHRLHADYGTDPSNRRAAAEGRVALDEGASDQPRNRNAERVQALLRGGGTDTLQQAFILQELLGPPVAMKDD